MHSASASASGGERERNAQGEEQSRGTLARTVPRSQLRLSAADRAHWVLALGPSRILTVPAVPSPCWPLSRLLLPEPWTLPSICALCPRPSVLWGPPRLALGHMGAQHPLSSLRNHLLLRGAGPTPTYLGITSWRAGQLRGPGGCGGPSSALRPPHPLGSAPAFGCGAGKRWR